MPPDLPEIDSRHRWLLVVAAPIEARAIVHGVTGADPGENPAILWEGRELSPRFDMVVSGVGKSAAAGATARVLDSARHAGVISVGIGGALPGSGLALGEALAASVSVFADEGVRTPSGYQTLAEIGFAPFGAGQSDGMGAAGSASILDSLSGVTERTGVVATVSTCSGTDQAARAIAERTGALVEAMEGAAVGLAAQRACPTTVAFGELRVVSNTTGNRANQEWDLPGALARLRELVGLL